MPRRNSAGSVISAHKLERAVLVVAYVHYAIAYLAFRLSAIASMRFVALMFSRENPCARIAPGFSILRTPTQQKGGRLSGIDGYAGNVSRYASQGNTRSRRP